MSNLAHFHLPGLFEFYDLYRVFLPLWRENRYYFYDWCKIDSLYGAPGGYLWSGGRTGGGNTSVDECLSLAREYNISPRLTFSNSLLGKEHLSDKKCNTLCKMLEKSGKGGVIIHSDLLLEHIKLNYPGLYFVSSTTKVLTDFDDFNAELNRGDFRYVVPDFRLNKRFDRLYELSPALKDKVEFLCNECCYVGCPERKECYENISRRILGEECGEHICMAPGGSEGYKFSKAMASPGFIGIDDIKNIYLPMGFSNFKIEGRGLGSALVLEMLLYYLVKPRYHIHVREAVYLDSMLDLF